MSQSGARSSSMSTKLGNDIGPAGDPATASGRRHSEHRHSAGMATRADPKTGA